MEEAKQQIVERLKQANNVLVTVSRDPSVDQLAAAIGLALFLNKLNKHASAVFSGRIPPVLEFLQPEKTLEKNTDSLRDFIIALDKSKADKLRYKVEDEHVKIFITPYRTSITQEDLEFSQGDFNVDVVVALGVQEQKDLDQAIVAHGRILHDATVVSLSLQQGASIGAMNWVAPKASSLCEMITELIDPIKANALDGQMATALLTGIVAETARFSNEKTTSVTMTVSGKLLSAGANQQLVAESLAPKPAPPPPPPPAPEEPVEDAPKFNPLDYGPPETTGVPPTPGDVQQPTVPVEDQGMSLPPVQPEEKPADGALYIDHEAQEPEAPAEEEEAADLEQIHIDEQGELRPIQEDVAPSMPLPQPQEAPVSGPQIMPAGSSMGEPPAAPNPDEATTVDPLTTELPPSQSERHLLSHEEPAFTPPPQVGEMPSIDPLGFVTPATQNDNYNHPVDPMLSPSEPPAGQPAPAADQPLSGPTQTLSDIEQSVSSPHAQEPSLFGQPSPALTVPAPTPAPSADAARDAVNDAMNGASQPLPPITALNAQPLNIGLPGDQPTPEPLSQAVPAPLGDTSQQPPVVPVQAMPAPGEPVTSDFSFPDHLIQPTDQNAAPSTPASSAPPVPPPMMPGLGFPPAPGAGPSGLPSPSPRSQPPVGY